MVTLSHRNRSSSEALFSLRDQLTCWNRTLLWDPACQVRNECSSKKIELILKRTNTESNEK